MKNRLALFALIAAFILLIFTPAINPQEAEFFGNCSSEQVAKLHKSGFTDQEIRDLCACQTSTKDREIIEELENKVNGFKEKVDSLTNKQKSLQDEVNDLNDRLDSILEHYGNSWRNSASQQATDYKEYMRNKEAVEKADARIDSKDSGKRDR